LRIGNLSISLSCCLDGPQNKQGQIASQIISTGWPHAVESVATSSWNDWPHARGIRKYWFDSPKTAKDALEKLIAGW